MVRLICVVMYMSADLVKIMDMNIGLEKEVEHLSESSVRCLQFLYLTQYRSTGCVCVCVCRSQSW